MPLWGCPAGASAPRRESAPFCAIFIRPNGKTFLRSAVFQQVTQSIEKHGALGITCAEHLRPRRIGDAGDVAAKIADRLAFAVV